MRKTNIAAVKFMVLLLIIMSVLCGCSVSDAPENEVSGGAAVFADNDISKQALEYAESIVSEDGEYSTASEVAAYVHIYKKLPQNFITKKEAKKLGWDSGEGNLDKVAPGKSIGGDYFGNFEGVLPETKGVKYTECDINFDGTYRNGERLVFDNRGNIYYSDDHYRSFEKVYGED